MKDERERGRVAAFKGVGRVGLALEHGTGKDWRQFYWRPEKERGFRNGRMARLDQRETTVSLVLCQGMDGWDTDRQMTSASYSRRGCRCTLHAARCTTSMQSSVQYGARYQASGARAAQNRDCCSGSPALMHRSASQRSSRAGPSTSRGVVDAPVGLPVERRRDQAVPRQVVGLDAAVGLRQVVAAWCTWLFYITRRP